MTVSAVTPTDDELTTFVKVRLAVSGFDISLLPTEFDPETGVPTQDSLISSLKSFVRSSPGAINTWRPPSGIASDDDLYAQQVAPPLTYPSITEAWTGKVGA